MKQFTDTLKNILDNGHTHSDRTGVGRRSIYGVMLKFNHKDGFPLVTTRQVPYKSMIRETLWFLTGSTKAKECGSGIWDLWALKENDIDNFLKKHENIFNEDSRDISIDVRFTSKIENKDNISVRKFSQKSIIFKKIENSFYITTTY